MPRNGSGIFTLVASYFATAGQTIRTEQHNPPLEDIAQGLTDSLPRNGTAAMTGNLPMGGRKITNLGAATVASDAVRFDQLPAVVVQSGPYDTTPGRILPVGAFGLGVLGAVEPLADLDDVATASGTLRFGPSMTGTYPVGVIAGSGGKITIARGAAGNGYEILQPNNADTMFWRRLATSWQPWMQVVSILDSTVADGDTIARISGAWARVAKGAAGQIYRQNDPLTAPIWSDAIIARAVQPTTAGTAFDFTAIPAWVRRITVNLSGVSISGSDTAIIQLGTSAGFVVAGYLGAISTIQGGATATNSTSAGFPAGWTAAAEAVSFQMILTRMGTTNTWVQGGMGVRTVSGANLTSSGVITLADTLTQVRLTRTGTDTFDAGSVSIIYE